MQMFATTSLKQRQGITITAQLQQAIQLLQYNNMELAQYIEEQAQENPFIELSTPDQSNATINNAAETKADASDQKIQIENQFETGEAAGTTKQTSSSAKTDKEFTTDHIKAENISIYEHAFNFAKTQFDDPKEAHLAFMLCEELEPSGWLTTPLEDIASRALCDPTDVEEILLKLQDISPTGLFARNLRECITLQLKEQNSFTVKTAQIVENLDQLAKGNLEQLKRKYSISDSDMIAIIKSIRSVNPKPGSEFYSSDEPIVAPDLKIIRKGDQWTVQLFSSNIPTISIQKDFAKTAISNALTSDHLDFLKTSLSEANWLKRAIAQRNETTLKIGLAILKFQLSYFDRGPAYLVPLTLKDIAEEIGVHESTVSRATNSSLIETPFGVLPLKFFFSSKIDSGNASSTQSGASMRHKIADLIRNERPSSPLSDEAIVEEFKRMGTTIARRTVAKYRKMENIPSSFDRKKQFILKGLVS